MRRLSELVNQLKPNQAGNDHSPSPLSRDGEEKTLVNLQNISVERQSGVLLENINLTVKQGEIVTIVGPNGAGKSTLVKVALGLMKPSSGQVEVRPSLSVGYVPQDIDMDDTLPIMVNRFLQLNKRYSNADLHAALKQVHATKLFHSPLQTLSGGEVRRVLLARALLKNADLLILDEPTAGVDVAGQAEIFTLIKHIRDQRKCGILLISHDLHVVMAATDRVVCLNRHLCCSGSPEHVQQHPEFVALFGQSDANKFAIYAHHHDHSHDLHGDIQSRDDNTHVDSEHG